MFKIVANEYMLMLQIYLDLKKNGLVADFFNFLFFAFDYSSRKKYTKKYNRF